MVYRGGDGSDFADPEADLRAALRFRLAPV